MALMKTSNPALGQNTFNDFAQSRYGGNLVDASARMTLNGTVNRIGILLLCAVATAAWTWNRFLGTHDLTFAGPAVLGGALGGLVFAMITIFKKEWSPVTAPVYALLEGFVLGGLSAVLEMRYPGIAMEAVALTFGVLFVMLLAYKSGLIKVTDKLRMGIVAATGAIAVFYFLTFLLGMFHITLFSAVYGSGAIGLVFSFVVVAIAALNLVLDFDFIERGVAVGAPKYMEWYAAFGIMVTLVWLYIEMLRLLSKLRSRN
ncbi:MAG: Bax inhibitor-1/YccA family protein [Terracidiphilus sp.]